jgi:hypothetical protein
MHYVAGRQSPTLPLALEARLSMNDKTLNEGGVEQSQSARALDALVATRVMGDMLTIPRERAMAIVGATYTVVTGPTFTLDVHGYDLTVRVPPGDSLPAHESDDNFNQRYFRHVVAELLEYPNEIAALVARDVESCRLPPRPYSTDIAAAWEVLEKLIAMGGYPELSRIFGGHEADWWRCEVRYAHASGVGRLLYEAAETAPLAICRAALTATDPATTPPEKDQLP